MLSTLPNVKVISTEYSSLSLIKNSIFVATLTGTVGPEAAFLGVKCLFFGRPWYEGLANSYKYSSSLSFEKITTSPSLAPQQVLQSLLSLINTYTVAAYQNENNKYKFSSFLPDDFENFEYLRLGKALMACLD